MGDKYDDAVAYLTKYPIGILIAWHQDGPGSELFSFVTRSGLNGESANGDTCGCLTQVRNRTYVAYTDALTAAIRADDRIPKESHEITIEILPVFAEWQRRIDRELGRT